MPTLRLFGGACVMSTPSTVIVPAVGCSKPAIIRRVVVLPQPDGPRNDTNSPFWAARLKSSTATFWANRFWTPVSSRNVMDGCPPSSSSRATNFDPDPGSATDHGNGDHREPCQPEADERHGRWLVRPVGSDQREVRPERRADEVRRDRVLADDDREAEERSGQERDAKVRQDDPKEDRRPARTHALSGFRQRPDVDRPEPRVDGAVHVR